MDAPEEGAPPRTSPLDAVGDPGGYTLETTAVKGDGMYWRRLLLVALMAGTVMTALAAVLDLLLEGVVSPTVLEICRVVVLTVTVFVIAALFGPRLVRNRRDADR
jgi:hypothetical protein